MSWRSFKQFQSVSESVDQYNIEIVSIKFCSSVHRVVSICLLCQVCLCQFVRVDKEWVYCYVSHLWLLNNGEIACIAYLIWIVWSSLNHNALLTILSVLNLSQFIANLLVILSKFVQLMGETVLWVYRQKVVDTTHVSGSLQKGLRGDGMNDEEG